MTTTPDLPAGASADDRAPAAPDVPPGAWRTLAISALAGLAVFLDTTALFVAFPDIGESFPSVAATELSWILNAYTIVFAALLVPAGKLGDKIGHKRAFLTGSAIFTIASMLCGLAPSAGILVAFRVVQAIGAATLVPASLALILRAFPPAKIPVAVAIWGAMGAVAGALGPTLGAVLVEWASWRWVFFLNLPIGLITIVLGRRRLAESRDESSELPSLVGVVLITLAAALVALGLVQGDEWGWTDPRTLGAILLGLALLGVFVVHQRRSASPVLDLELFSINNFRWGNAATFVFGTVFTAMFFSSILFLTNVWQYTVLEAGFATAPGPLIVAILAPRMGRLAGRIGQRPMLMVGGVVFALAGAWRISMLGAQPDFWRDLVPSTILTGIAVALCLPQLTSVVAQSLPPNRFGVGGGVNNAVRQFGGTIGVAVTIALIGAPSTLDDAVANFDKVWVMLVAGGLAVALLALPLRTRRIDS